MLKPDELTIAELMAAGELPSPQKFQNVLLYLLRITGVGASYRPALDEYVVRREEDYVTERFLKRCNGLPVVMGHPEGSILNSDEFEQRVVGTVFVPFIRDSEVWAVAKLFSQSAIDKLESEQMSTSPAVLLSGGTKMKMDDGSHVLFEGPATLLDHVAICAKGVWDKGGDPTGIEQSNLDDAPRADAIEEIGVLQRAVNAMAALRMDAAVLSSRVARR